MVHEMTGDLLSCDADYICHQTNFYGVMGAGVAASIHSKLTSDPRVSAVGVNGEMMLAGNLFVVQTDGGDDLQSLTEAEIRHVLLNAKWLVSLVHHDIRCVLTNCTY